MSPRLYHWNVDADGPLTEAAMVKKFEKLGYAPQPVTYTKGMVLHDHTHDETKIEGVLTGMLELNIAGEKYVLISGDWVEIPKNVVHNAKILGEGPVKCLEAEK